MHWKARLLYSQNWNIGFVEQSVEDLIDKQKLGRIRWMKHSFRDRWFADPFIYKVEDNEIVVFVEECQITDSPKGILCELHVDKKTMHLKERYVLLELETHLSYPAIIKKNGITYVYPENGSSGSLKMYRYDEQMHKLVEPICILGEAVADSTILVEKEKYYIVATRSESPLEGLLLYCSDAFDGPYILDCTSTVQKGRNCSRPAGNWIKVFKKHFRPAQDCSNRYGGGINIMSVESIDPYSERELFPINPKGFKYNLGIHTINESPTGGLMVVDGYGYLNPVIYRIWSLLSRFKAMIK